MADQKVDPLEEGFYGPLKRADRAAAVLFYVSGILSLAALLISRENQPDLNDWIQLLFVLSVLGLFCVTLAIRVHYFPRSQLARYQDFLSHAFGAELSHRLTTGYYNNSAKNTSTRIAAQVLESAFFTKNILARMVVRERIKIGVYTIFFVGALLYRKTDLAVISIAAQFVFSEQILSRHVRLEWFNRESERIYEELFRLMKNKSKMEVLANEFLGRYECLKASSTISTSTKIFQENRDELNAEWEEIRRALGI